MAIILLDSASNATSGAQGWTGTVSSSTEQARTGLRSLKATTEGDEFKRTGLFADAGRRFSFAIYLTGSPSTERAVAIIAEAGEGTVIAIRLTADRVLRLFSNAVQVGDDGSTLATGQWYRLCLSWTLLNTTTNEFRLYLDGEIDISLTNANLGNNAASMVRLFAPAASTYFADFYVDDATSLDDPGDIHVTAKLPTTVNANNWTAGGNGAVNERPLSQTNYVTRADAATIEQNYAIEAAADGDVDLSEATVVGYGSWAWANATTGGIGTPKITCNGSDTSITLTSSPAYYASAYVTSATYPANAATVGMVSTGVGDVTFMYECGMLVAYIPGGAEPPAEGGWLRYRK